MQVIIGSFLLNTIRQRIMEKAVTKRAKFTSPGCLDYVYLSCRALGDSMINILINESMLWPAVCIDDGFCLKSVSEGDVSMNSQKILSDGLWCRQGF